jgi:hypothetical protein
MRKILAISVTVGAVMAVAPAAYANTHSTGGGSATCNKDWYQNPDEASLKPKQLPQGMLFDGPSLIHHAPGAAYTLATVPANGGVHAKLLTGVLPLFKMETTAPYSTVNKTPAGKWWSSKVASGAGSQSEPVDSPADLVGAGTYTSATTILSFGAGYANDAGNKALVTSVRFGRHLYWLGCKPGHSTPTPTPNTSDTGTPTPTPTTSTPGEAPAPTPVNSDLPVTG